MKSAFFAGPRRSYAKLSFGGLMFFAIMSATSTQSAASQLNSVVPSHRTDIAARGQREVKDISYGNWRKLCFKPGGARILCRTSITGTFETGQLAVRLDIIEREGDPVKRIQIFSPVGMYLPTPVKLTIDNIYHHRIPYTWCLTNVCIASTVASPQLVLEMNRGHVLRLEFIESNLLSLTTSFQLDQFAHIHKSRPSQTFEQDIDE